MKEEILMLVEFLGCLLFERELVPVSDPFDPQSYKSLLKLNINLAQQTFPEVFKGN